MKRFSLFSIWLILIVALGLRLPLLGGSFWLDEAAQALESARPLSQQFDIIPDFQPPLLHLLIHFGLYAGESEWWLRTVGALIPGLITVYITYRIAADQGKPKQGLVAASLLATSSFHIFYSQELRPYALPAMWAVLSWWRLQRATKSGWTLKELLFLTVANIAGLYSSYLYPFLILGQLGWVGLQPKSNWRPMITSLALAGAAFTPWLPWFFRQLAAGGQVRLELPGWEAVVSIPQLKSLPLVLGKFVYGVIDLRLSPFIVLSSVILVGLTSWLMLRSWQRRSSLQLSPLVMYSIWFLVPLITAWIVSFWIPVVQPKRVLFLLPAAYLGLVSWIAMLKTRVIGYCFIGILLFINGVGTWNYYQQPMYQREDWRALHQELRTGYPVSSVAVFSFPEPFAPWRWYDDGSYPTLSTGALHVRDVDDLTQTLKPITNYSYVITFDYLRDLTDPNDALISEIEAFGYQLIEIKDYPNIGFVRIFAKPSATLSSR